MADTRTDIDGRPYRACLHNRRIGLGDITHVAKIPRHLRVPQLDYPVASAKVLDNLRYQELSRLTDAGVIEWAGDDQGQSIHPQPRHVLHRQLAYGIVIRRCWQGFLGDRLHFGVAVNVGTAGQHHEFGWLSQLRQRFEEIAGTHDVDPIDRVDVAVRDKRNRREVHDHVWLNRCHCRTHGLAIEQVGSNGTFAIRCRVITQANHLVTGRLQFSGHIATGEPIAAGQQRTRPAHVRTTLRAHCAPYRLSPSFGTVPPGWFLPPIPACYALFRDFRSAVPLPQDGNSAD